MKATCVVLILAMVPAPLLSGCCALPHAASVFRKDDAGGCMMGPASHGAAHAPTTADAEEGAQESTH